MTIRKKHSLLLVDDEATNLQLLRHTLQDEYRLIFAKNGSTALELAQQERPDLILLDIMMADMSGYSVCEQLKDHPVTRRIPVIFVSALNDSGDEQQGFALGAVDYITKPFNPAIVKARVRTHLSLVQADEVLESRLQIVQCLGKAAEYRDNETGMHILRISHFARTIAKAIGYSDERADDLLHAAPMHDVGKIGVPDAILLKPGKLNPEEWEIMRQHTTIGAQIIGEHDSSMLKLAASIALCHHEKWDGSGYPNGLAGEDIPQEARIIALVDVFDALTSERPYKKAWPIDEALDFIRQQRGSHFEPKLVDVFMDCLPEILAIRSRWADHWD